MFNGLKNTTKYKKACGFLLIFVSVLGLGFFLAWFGTRIFADRNMQYSTRWIEEETELYVRVPVSFLKKERIALRYDDRMARYMLFLPAMGREESITFYDAEGDLFVLDGATLPDGKVSNLQEGMHALTLSGSDGSHSSKQYDLEVMYSSDIRTMFISMQNEQKVSMLESPYLPEEGAYLTIYDAAGDLVDESGVASMRVRGNTSADWVKKPFQITLTQSRDLCGLGDGIRWNLLSNWSDKTLLRNQVAFDMAKAGGLPYTPDACFTDLYLNGEYMGCYQLCEKVEIGKDRVNITDLEAYTIPDRSLLEKKNKAVRASADGAVTENGMRLMGYETQLGTADLSGGYLLEIERPSRITDSMSYFVTRNGQPVTVKSPQIADINEVRYIAGVWQTFEDALFAEDGKNPGTGKAYTDYIDLDSYVRKYLVEEITRNYDASSTSQYFYKEKGDDRLHAGPAWDYDMSLGNPIMSPLTNQNYISSVSPTGLFASLPMDDFSLWSHLYEKPDFEARVKELYRMDFLPYLQELAGSLPKEAKKLHDATIMDGVRWGRNKGETEEEREAVLADEVGILQDFLQKREAYLTGLWLDGRETKRVYLDGGDADQYVSYVENLIGEPLQEPPEPLMEGFTFKEWLNGYTLKPYDWTKPLNDEPLYLVASYTNDQDGRILIAGQ